MGTHGAGDILRRRRHSKSVIIFPRANFSWRRYSNVLPAGTDSKQDKTTGADQPESVQSSPDV